MKFCHEILETNYQLSCSENPKFGATEKRETGKPGTNSQGWKTKE